MSLKEVTNKRPVIYCSLVEFEGQKFYSLVVHNGSEIVDEIFNKYIDSVDLLQTLSKLTETYGRYSCDLLELHTDILEVVKLALNIPGLHVRPLRRKDLEPFTNRILLTWGDTIRELYIPKEVTVKRASKWRKWLINLLINAINILDKSKGDK
jgi:hypothetical protein